MSKCTTFFIWSNIIIPITYSDTNYYFGLSHFVWALHSYLSCNTKYLQSQAKIIYTGMAYLVECEYTLHWPSCIYAQNCCALMHFSQYKIFSPRTKRASACMALSSRQQRYNAVQVSNILPVEFKKCTRTGI